MKSLINKRIFIVDDNPYWVALQTQLLNDLGFTKIITFTNGADCINNLHLNPILVFLDYHMEGENGLEVLQKIKNYYSGINVVFCTANEDLSVAVNAIKYGSQDYLLKENASKKELIHILERIEKRKALHTIN
ncbi:MAG: response regulator [Pedobacter sp.]|nr:response regulator [Chitinophagaceae bacterium]